MANLRTTSRSGVLLLAIALLANVASAGASHSFAQVQISLAGENVPDKVAQCLASAVPPLVISTRLNPYYLRGDFDGDGKPDYSVLIEGRAGRGIAFCLSSRSGPLILGAGIDFHGMKDLAFDAWRVFEGARVERGVEAGPPPKLRGEPVLVVWDESASALIYWNGTRLAWYQQGD